MKTIVLLLFLPVLIFSCKTNPPGITKSNQNDRIALMKAGGIGGPGEAFTLELTRKGKVLFQGQARGGLKGRHEWSCDEDTRRAIWQSIDELDLASLPDSYPPSSVDSGPTLLRFELGEVVKEVKYFTKTDAQIQSLEQNLRELVRMYDEWMSG